MNEESSTRPRRGFRWWLAVGGQTIAWAVVVICFLAIVATVLVPRLIGAEPYTVVSSSMEPAIPVGSIVVAQEVSEGQVQFDDIVTYQLESGEPQTVTHRVVAVDIVEGETRYRTQGDANDSADADPVRPEQVRGKVIYHVPYLGYVGTWLPMDVRPKLAAIAGIGLLVYAAVLLLRNVFSGREKKAAH